MKEFLVQLLFREAKNPKWQMDPNYVCPKPEREDKTETYYRHLDTQIELLRREVDLIFIKAEMKLGSNSVRARKFINKGIGLPIFNTKKDEIYLGDLESLVNEEAENILLGNPPNKEAVEKLHNILFLGKDYNPSYNHEAYIAKAKANSITG